MQPTFNVVKGTNKREQYKTKKCFFCFFERDLQMMTRNLMGHET